MLSAAYFGLTQAIAWVKEGRGAGHEGPYITVTMHRFLREALVFDASVPIDLVAETLHTSAHVDGELIVNESLSRLTPRERLVVSLRLLGETQVQIAAALSVSQPTVSTILDSIRRKL
jgi:DNA-binding CsgD family transcriptional regulator